MYSWICFKTGGFKSGTILPKEENVDYLHCGFNFLSVFFVLDICGRTVKLSFQWGAPDNGGKPTLYKIRHGLVDMDTGDVLRLNDRRTRGQQRLYQPTANV